MTAAKAKETQRALKDATKKAAEKDITKPKHESHPDNATVDSPQEPVVNSGFSIFNQVTPGKEQGMTAQESRASATQADKEAAAKAKIAAKAEKLAAAEAKKAEREAKKAAAEAAAAEKKAMTEAERTAKKAEADARAEALRAQGRKYVGSMLSLADRVKEGVYVKSATGQLRSTDDLATALDEILPTGVIALGLKLLKLDMNPYEKLNIGQQSMNLRNRLRGALRKGEINMTAIHDELATGAYPSIKAEREAKAAAKAEREAKAAQAKANKEAAAAVKKAEREAAVAAKAAEKEAKKAAAEGAVA